MINNKTEEKEVEENMSYSETSSMDTLMTEDYDSSFVSNTDATICNTADLCSAWGSSLISGPIISASSDSTSIGDDMIISGASSSRLFTHNQSHDEQEIRIFNVDFSRFSSNPSSKEDEAEKRAVRNEQGDANSPPNQDIGKQQHFSDMVELKKGPWTVEEDFKLIDYIQRYGHWNWSLLPKYAGLLRSGNSCRFRWMNYLRPGVRRGPLSEEEVKIVIDLHAQFGNRWSKIASHLPGRTDNEIKKQWTSIKGKLKKMGIDPVTHKTTYHYATGLSQILKFTI